HEASLALYGLDHDRCDALGRDLRHERALECGQRVARARAPVLLRVRDAIHVRGERAEARLVRVCLRGEREREQRAAVEPAFESGSATTKALRCRIPAERGPGIAVRSSIDFVAAI